MSSPLLKNRFSNGQIGSLVLGGGSILQKMLMKYRSCHGKPGLHKESNMAAIKPTWAN